MIVRETEQEIIMVRQHDHAQLSGDVARNFKSYFMDDPFFDDLLIAVYQHDLAWIRLDETPIWNDRESVPFSFTDYPLLPKLTHYQYGLDQTEKMNKVAGLLCSLHYSSFGFIRNSPLEECVEFIRYEEERQQRIRTKLKLTDHKAINKHFRLLQLCDVISLYVCLNRPGVSKEQEISRYRDGFEDSELFNHINDSRLVAEWLNDKEIRITPNPFEKAFETHVRQKRVPKSLIKELGIGSAYKQSEWIHQEIIFVGNLS